MDRWWGGRCRGGLSRFGIAGALLAPLPQRLAQLGVAIIGEPMTVPLGWFPRGGGEPIATLTADEIDPITDALRALIGRLP